MEYKQEALALVSQQGYTVTQAAEALGIKPDLLYRWKRKAEKRKKVWHHGPDERVGACGDNAVMERFFGSLKSEWLSNVRYLTRASMREDVQAYMRYYNHQRLHTSNGNQTPIAFEKGEYLQNKVSEII